MRQTKKRLGTILVPTDLPNLRALSLEYGSTEPVHHRTGQDPYKQPMDQKQWLTVITALKKNTPAAVLQRLRFLALGIREGLLWADDIMDRYCAATCNECQSPCCNVDGIYYDRADLLYVLALDADLPYSQTREKTKEPCCYLTPEGCMLPRMCRPFICTWYLCEPQMTLFQQETPRFQRQFTAITQTIRHCRLQIDALHGEGSNG